MNRGQYIELIRRAIYGGQPTDDANITVNQVNLLLSPGIAVAAKANYLENIKLDGIGYSSNSFYSTFKDISIAADDSDNFQYSIDLPQVPYALGRTDGISMLKFKKDGEVSYTAIPISQSQWAYQDGYRKIPNAITYCTEGGRVKIKSVVPLWSYKANVTMVSSGDSQDLTSELNLPDEYFPMIVDFVRKELMLQRSMPTDQNNDGTDGPIKTT